MSNRSIIELNHDFVHAIKESPDDFLELLVSALNSGSQDRWEELERFGVKYTATTHHSTAREVVMPWKEYVL